MTTTHDFLIVRGGNHRSTNDETLRWHGHLGGSRAAWHSAALKCTIWGATPAESVTADGRRTACILAGAPIGFNTTDISQLQTALLNAYRHGGLDALNLVDGAFCGAVIDEVTPAVHVFTDRYGFRKAFLARNGGVSYASSRAVVLGRGLELPLDEAGIVSLVVIGHTLGKRTLFDGCSALMPGTAYDLVAGREHCYWRIAPFLAARPRDPRTANELRERFNGACAAITGAQEVPATNVTGGFDTRAILSATLAAGTSMIGITAGRTEADAIDRIVAHVGLRHYYLEEHDDSDSGARWFALLTDGEWDATNGGYLLRHWQRAGTLAPSGCLHGGLGEVWRSYHYKFLWPPTSRTRRSPVAYLADRLTRTRRHLAGLLSESLARRARAIVVSEIESTWSTVVEAEDTLAAVDGFYLLERQRGLSRIASAADLWYPAYAPFGHSRFAEVALSYLGSQNRAETLHRAIIAGNSPVLARLPIAGGGTAGPLSSMSRAALLGGATARHLAGRAIGGSLRRRLTHGAAGGQYPHAVDVARLAGTGFFDASRTRAAVTASVDGIGSVAAISLVLQAESTGGADRPAITASADVLQEPQAV